MTDEPLNPIERLRVHLTLEHHEEDAEAFELVDSLVRNYLLTDEPMTQDAIGLQNMLLDVVESWTPNADIQEPNVSDTDFVAQTCPEAFLQQEVSTLRARVAELEARLGEWCEPGDCGCETATCTGLCLSARTLNTLNR